MATTITVNKPTDDETNPIIQTHVEHQHLLHPSTKTFKPFPPAIIQSIEAARRPGLPASHSTSDFLSVKQSSIDTTDDDLDENNQTTTTTKLYQNCKLSKLPSRAKRSPSEVRVTLYLDENVNIHENLTNSQLEVSKSESNDEFRSSDPSLLDTKLSKQNRVDYLRRTLLDNRFGRRIHSSFSSSTTLRSLSRRRSTQNLASRQSSNVTRNRRQAFHLPRNSKWHIVRHRLHDIAMMSESYARMKLVERDKRWTDLRDKIRAQVLDMREMSILRQQDDGVLSKKKSQKPKFDLKAIPANDVVHVEHDGQVFSLGTRDLVLGRSNNGDEIQLDTFAQLYARRLFQVRQRLVKQQEGRTRLKKHIAFSFCLCNLSFIALMFAAMFIFAMKTILELRSREFV